ncbi:MAG: peptidylprolyl isomerase [Planctomycetales bacterium]
MHTQRSQDAHRLHVAKQEIRRRHADRAGKSWPLMVMGTVTAILIAAVSFQFFRPTTGQAVDREAAQRRTASKQSTTTVREESTEATPNSKKYLARVGNKFITREEVIEECMVRHQTEVLENLINRKIIEIACDENGIKISDAEVDQEVIKTAQKYGMSVEQWYNMMQTERNVPAAHYRRDIVWPMIALKKLAGKDVEITEQDLKQAFIREYGERVKAKVIVMDNVRRATEVWNKVQAHPEDFEKFVKENSVEPNSRALGGSVPPIQRFSGNPDVRELEEKVFKLKQGEISSVIQVVTQYYIIRCEGRTEPIIATMDEVREHLQEDLKTQKTQQAVATLFESISQRTRVDNYLTNTHRGGEKGAPTGSATGNIKQTGNQGESRNVTPATKPVRKVEAEE